MRREVATAIDELQKAFPTSVLVSREDGDGGAYVIVESVEIGSRYRPSSTWLGGHITALYPYSDIYPLFMAAEVQRTDGAPFTPPITPGAHFLDRPALQISRRNNHTQNFPQTAVAKFAKVLHFLEVV